ncbi:MAG: response regulator transcription factor, partial [Clostridia bacterium]|nr:response regulator transcription factor [Clostridia bacterium]
ILLDGLVLSLSKEKSVSIVAALTDAEEILPALETSGVEVVLTDIITKGNRNALDYVASIRQAYPQVKIIAITGFPDITFMEKARKEGVNSFVYKNISTEELVSVIKNTYAGYSVFPSPDKSRIAFWDAMSDAERKVLRLYCKGMEREQIAQEMFISQSSVKSHISSILQKTGFSSMARVAIYAVSTGLVFTE